MIRLYSRGLAQGIDTPLVGVARWVMPGQLLGVYRTQVEAQSDECVPWGLVSRLGVSHPLLSTKKIPSITVAEEIQPLNTGDVVVLQESGRVDTLFRVGSKHNSLFVTEQCNSYCLMCSQPPRRVHDIEYFLALNARALQLIPGDAEVLGITGGEPTLLAERLSDLLRLCRERLPGAQVEVLSNARRLADDGLVAHIADACDDGVLFTVPLYADNAMRHDYVVQARGAFDETMRGLYNLAVLGVRCEIRVVLHRVTAPRLSQLARYIQRNLPFAEQVAFMGLEMTGLARANEDLLWIEPPEYMSTLQEAIDCLDGAGMRASIYNLPRCLVPESLWPYLRQSISDWKREFASQCEGCRERSDCGGLFGTSSRVSSLLRVL